MPTNNKNTRSGNIIKFDVTSNVTGRTISLLAGITVLSYYEDVLKNTVTLTITVAEASMLEDKGVIDGLPLRGGERADIIFEDENQTKLKFEGDNSLYINRIRDISPDTQVSIYYIDFCSREFISNEQCRVVKRYDGKISDNIEKILTKNTSKSAGIKTKKFIDADPTAINYNFIGNDKKPFYICTWLASKSIPSEAGKIGGAAGYFFFETYDGYKFKAIDVLTSQTPRLNVVYTNTAILPVGFDAKILDYSVERDIDLIDNLMVGAYSNRTIFFDFYNFEYKVEEFNVASASGKIETAGKEEMKDPLEGTDIADEDISLPVSRLMTKILDIGTLPSGKNVDSQLRKSKRKESRLNYDAPQTLAKSIMRYNQLFTIKIKITLGGLFGLRAGDLLNCSFPKLNDSGDTNAVTGGIYMISSVHHKITPKTCFTYVTLVRDTFGKKTIKRGN